MGKRIREVDEYLSELEPDRRAPLTTLRDLIFEAAPDAVETMRYGMPTYEYQGDIICAFASQKHYMSLYMDPGVVANHKEDLKGLNIGKGCIRFKKIEDLPLDTVEVMLNETVQRT